MFSRSRAALAAAFALTGVCATQAASSPAAPTPWSTATKFAVVQDVRINEASGLTRSSYSRTVLFVHNDSGDTSRFFAISSTGGTLGVFTLPAAPSQDWEDVATGPGHALWFGDIGDNQTRKSYISVIRTTEPQSLASRSLPSTTYKLQYPGGTARNAEALMVHPTSGRVYVITKEKNGGHVYAAPQPLRAGVTNKLTAVATAPATVTGGDFSPNGNSFVLRTYAKAYLYFKMGGSPRVINLPSNGESIGFNRAGNALLIGSEGIRKPIWRVVR